MAKELSMKKRQELVRNEYLAKIRESLEQLDCECLTTASNEICIPCVDSDNYEHYVIVKVSVPTGSRDGELYDGYAVAEDYKRKCAEKEEKAKAQAEAKAKKIARDEQRRKKG